MREAVLLGELGHIQLNEGNCRRRGTRRRAFASSVFTSTPVGPQKINEPMGRFGPDTGACKWIDWARA